jgi:copper(I)-binding protein
VRKRASLASTAVALTVVGVSVSGCSASKALAATNAYVLVPSSTGSTVGYLEIRNNSSNANDLVSVKTSVGGSVQFAAPVVIDGTVTTATRDVSQIPLPANTTVHLAPNSYHLLISGVPGLQGGKAITLRLTFAHGGTVSVVGLVTNPASGGSSYFLN